MNKQIIDELLSTMIGNWTITPPSDISKNRKPLRGGKTPQATRRPQNFEIYRGEVLRYHYMLARGRAKGKRPAKKKATGRSVIVCALCSKIIKSPAGGGGDMVIYSICPVCKRLRPRVI